MSTKTHYYVEIPIDTETLISEFKMLSKCEDAIFVLEDDPAQLWRSIWPHTADDEETIFHVKIPELAEGSTQLYIYYGNPDAATEVNPNDMGNQDDPIKSHRELMNLDYETAAHTGFASSESVVEKIDLLEMINLTMDKILIHFEIMTGNHIEDDDVWPM